MADRTIAEQFCAEEARRLLAEETAWRSVVVIVSYKRPGDGERDVSIANAIAMKSLDAALDVVMLSKRLRTLADELDQVIAGQRPLPPREEPG